MGETGILGLAHIGIRVRDMDASIRFYTELLGFTLSSQQTFGTTQLAFLGCGTCLIELIHPTDYSAKDAGEIDHFAVEVKGIEALTARLKAQGVHFLSDEINVAPTLIDGVKNIFFTGPDGERIEFFEYYNR